MGSRSHCFILRFRSICFEMNRLVACYSVALSFIFSFVEFSLPLDLLALSSMLPVTSRLPGWSPLWAGTNIDKLATS